MANHCHNTLTLEGNAKDIKEVLERLNTEDNNLISFENLIKGEECSLGLYPAFYDNSVSFRSIYRPPLSCLKNISALYPEIIFYINFSEFLMDFQGYAAYKNGKCVRRVEIPMYGHRQKLYELQVDFDNLLLDEDVDKVQEYLDNGEYERAYKIISHKIDYQSANIEHIHYIATMYYYGDYLDQSSELAQKYYKIASDRGNNYSMFLLGKMYYFGEGITQDIIQGTSLITTAASYHCDSAIDFMKEHSINSGDNRHADSNNSTNS